MGDSIGHWEGDTLVVDTTNFTDKTRFRGSGENLHVIERFSPRRSEHDSIPGYHRRSGKLREAVDARISLPGDCGSNLRICMS